MQRQRQGLLMPWKLTSCDGIDEQTRIQAGGCTKQEVLEQRGFCSLGWAVMACRLLLAVWLVLAMWAGLVGSVWLATMVVLAPI